MKKQQKTKCDDIMNKLQALREKLKELFEKTEYNNNVLLDEEIEEITYNLEDHLDYCKKFNEQTVLYRYSNTDFYNLRNLQKGVIKLSAIGEMNDIFDGIPSSDMNILNDEDLEELKKMAYIKSFSETKENLLMWAHYAEQYKGICVGYDISLLSKDHRSIKQFFPIVYCDGKRPIITDIAEHASEMRDISEAIRNDELLYKRSSDNILYMMFLSKADCWSYEREWRIVVPKHIMYGSYLNENGQDVYPDKIVDFDCASEVYLGYRMPKDMRDYIVEMVESLNQSRHVKGKKKIKIYKTKLSESEYRLIFEEI